MGQSLSSDIYQCREIILSTLLNSNALTALFNSTPQNARDELLYHTIFPYEHLPEETENGKRISFELKSVLNLKNRTMTDMTLRFFILCSTSELITPSGLWCDNAAHIIGQLLNTNAVPALNGIKFYSNLPCNHIKNFKGRILRFTFNRFSDGTNHGK